MPGRSCRVPRRAPLSKRRAHSCSPCAARAQDDAHQVVQPQRPHLVRWEASPRGGTARRAGAVVRRKATDERRRSAKGPAYSRARGRPIGECGLTGDDRGREGAPTRAAQPRRRGLCTEGLNPSRPPFREINFGRRQVRHLADRGPIGNASNSTRATRDRGRCAKAHAHPPPTRKGIPPWPTSEAASGAAQP